MKKGIVHGKGLKMDKLQTLVDFYNLHLKSGCIPDEKEKEKLIEFFSYYMPQITDCISANEYNRELSDEDLVSLGLYQLKRIKNAVQRISQGELSHDAEMLLSLVRKQKITEFWLDSDHFIDFLEKHGDRFSWFNSDDFLGFVDEYAHVKSIVDGYIDTRVIKADIEWLNEYIEKYNMSLLATNRNTKEEYLVGAVEVPEDFSFSLDEWYIHQEGQWCDAERYGICLGSIIFDIHMDLITMLEEELNVRRCAFKGGKRIPKCENVFISRRKNMKYCSNKCYDRARVARRLK